MIDQISSFVCGVRIIKRPINGQFICLRFQAQAFKPNPNRSKKIKDFKNMPRDLSLTTEERLPVKKMFSACRY